MTEKKSGDILVLGDACLDIDVYLSKPSVAGNPVKEVKLVEAGSAGNVAYRLSEFGLDVGLMAPISDDAIGRTLVSLIARNHRGVALYPISIDGQQPCVVNLIDAKGARRSYYKWNPGIMDLDEAETVALRYKAVHISGYIFELVKAEALVRFVKRLRNEGISLSLDLFPRVKRSRPNSEVFKALNQLNILFGTLREFERLTGSGKMTEICEFFTNQVELVIKKGSEGATVMIGRGIFSSRPRKVTPVSLKGAGDALIARYLTSRLKGQDVKDSISAATEFAALFVAGRAHTALT